MELNSTIPITDLPNVHKLDPFIEHACRTATPDSERDYGSRKIAICTDINPAVCHKVVEDLLAFESASPGLPVHIFLFSPGGCVNSGLAIIDTMEHITSPVFTYCMGYAASMAAVILAAGHPGYRYILPHSRVMIHQTMGAFNGSMENVRSLVNLQNTLEQELELLLSQKTGQSVEEIHRATRFDKWLDSREAIEFGLVDHSLQRGSKVEPRI